MNQKFYAYFSLFLYFPRLRNFGNILLSHILLCPSLSLHSLYLLRKCLRIRNCLFIVIDDSMQQRLVVRCCKNIYVQATECYCADCINIFVEEVRFPVEGKYS